MGQGGNGEDCLMATGSPFGLRNMFWNSTEMVVGQHGEHAKCH